MKTFLLITCLFLTGTKLFAQDESADSSKWIEESESMGMRYLIQTNSVLIDTLNFVFQSLNNTMYVEIIGTNSFLESLNKKDKMIFTFTNNDKSILRSVQNNNEGYATSGDVYSHEYYIFMNELKSLTSKTVQSIQISKGNTYSTLTVSQTDAENLRQSAKAFLEEYFKKRLKK